MMTSPTSRTLQRLRQLGYVADVVERFVAAAQKRRDWCGFADILAAHPDLGQVLLVQATTGSHVAARLAKAQARPEMAAWLRAGGKFEVWGWQQRNGAWSLRRVEVQPGGAAVDLTPKKRPHQQRRGERQGELFSERQTT